MQTDYKVVGVMSGTSLDGLDIARCNFRFENRQWSFSIEKAKTFQYDNHWKQQLSMAETLQGLDLIKLHNDFGKYSGIIINEFLGNYKDIDFIASHGHTVFHQPNIGLTLQIGNGAHIAATTGLTTICDFRSMDVALGGQGAPLVPVGDKLLFNQFNSCLNLGGFANISYESDNKRIAYDICPVNIVTNQLAKEYHLKYDEDGNIGRKGNINPDLLKELNNIQFYLQTGPKSLGKEWVSDQIIPVLERYPIRLEDKLRTFYEHITDQLINTFRYGKIKSVMITGGGTYNKFLIETLRNKISIEINIPDAEIIEFKEALIFAFLGVLCFRNEANCLRSVTGAKTNNIGGIIYKI